MTNWIQRHGAPGRRALLCFAHAGGCASYFRPWLELLPQGVELLATQWPGRENRIREPLVSSLELGVQAIADGVESLDAERLCFFGHSLGALVAFEVARELRRRGRDLPDALCVSGAGAPEAARSLPTVHRLPDGELLATLAERYEAIPRIILDDTELTGFYAGLLRADISMLETYRYVSEPRLSCPIFAFAGSHDRVATLDSVALWREQTSAGFDLQSFPGGHFFLRDHAPALLAALVGTLRTDYAPARLHGGSDERSLDPA
jgi:surfactin synthase thioesterase subunit